MNRLFFTILFLIVFICSLLAQTQMLTIYRADGKKIQYPFPDKPEITFDNSNLYIKSTSVEVTYPLTNFEKYTVTESEDPLSLKEVTIDNDSLESFENTTDIPNCNITYKRTFEDTNWQPFYVPFDVKYSQLSDDFDIAVINNFHQYDDDYDGTYDRTELEIRKVTDEHTLMANYPYLIKAKEIGKHSISIPETTLYATEQYSIDCSSIELMYTFTGTYDKIFDLRSFGAYYLDNGLLNKSYSTTDTLPPFRWYMMMSARSSQFKNNPIILQAKSIHIVELGDNSNTAITQTESSSIAAITATYSINGMKTYTKTPGVYIQRMSDGSTKKVFIR